METIYRGLGPEALVGELKGNYLGPYITISFLHGMHFCHTKSGNSVFHLTDTENSTLGLKYDE